MSQPVPSPLQDLLCTVVSNQTVGANLQILRLRPQNSAFACVPGQFVMLDLPEARFHFRRPFSVLGVTEQGDFDLYYKVVGTGTRMMATWQPGLQTRCLGPLGVGFKVPQPADTVLYVGGGIGIAPLAFLGRSSPANHHCFYGVRSQTEIGLATELRQIFGEQLYISTDDGSFGTAGNVCDLLDQQHELVKAASHAYVCGPTRMMEASVHRLLTLNPQLNVQVSLEEHMPCGTGACTGCVVPRQDQALPSKVCLEGPVFDARAIRWNGTALPPSVFCEESPCPL